MKYKLLLFIKNNGEHGATCFGSWEPSSGLQIRVSVCAEAVGWGVVS